MRRFTKHKFKDGSAKNVKMVTSKLEKPQAPSFRGGWNALWAALGHKASGRREDSAPGVHKEGTTGASEQKPWGRAGPGAQGRRAGGHVGHVGQT